VSVTQAAGGQPVTEVAFQVAAVRTFAGPGHVIYSAFAGYYLGLAKFNPEDAGPIVVKGLVVASVIHATYNTAVTNLGAVAEFVGLAQGVAFLAFVVVYDGVFFYVLYRKLSAYRAAYVSTGAQAADRAAREPAADTENEPERQDRERKRESEAPGPDERDIDYRDGSGATESRDDSES
jgi:hypothetical protein